MDWVALPALVIAVVHAIVALVKWFNRRGAPPQIPPRL